MEEPGKHMVALSLEGAVCVVRSIFWRLSQRGSVLIGLAVTVLILLGGVTKLLPQAAWQGRSEVGELPTQLQQPSLVQLGNLSGGRADVCPQAVVAYTFMLGAGVSLWPVWEQYFSSCPIGSYTIVIHSQAAGRLNQKVLDAVAAAGGGVVPANETVRGQIRFSFKLFTVLERLWLKASRRFTTEHSCRPSWVHLLSDSCAPVRSCKEHHQSLTANPGVSRMEQALEFDTPFRKAIGRKAGVFSSLWLDDAVVLALDEATIAQRWGRLGEFGQIRQHWHEKYNFSLSPVEVATKRLQGSSEEFMIPTEMLLRGVKSQGSAPTYQDWSYTSAGHPRSFNTPYAVQYACTEARRQGFFFARKFAVGVVGKARRQVIHALLHTCLR